MHIRLTVVAALATLLASLGLYPLFEGAGWAWSGLGAIIAVAAGGVLARRLRLPAAAAAPVTLAALLVYLTVRYAPGQALLAVVPTPGSVTRLAQLVSDGWAAANRYAAPVPRGAGIELLATLGVGTVAVLVDLLAVRLRRAAPAGLPLLALYSVPAAIREESLNWVAFALGAAGFLALLLADSREQVGAWGRPVHGRYGGGEGRRERPDARSLVVTGRRLGLAAVAIAVTVPTVVPGVHPRGPFDLGGGGEDGGSQTVTTPDPLVSLKRELTRLGDQVVLTYQTDDPSPDYLRLYALDRFDGDRWTYSPLRSTPDDRVAGRNLPAPPGLLTARTHAVTTRISVAENVRNMTFLPAPYAPSRVSIRGDWRVDRESLMLYSLRDDAGGRSYNVTSVRAEPTAGQLAGAGPAAADVLRRHLRLPGGIPQPVRELADEVTEGARSQYEQAMMLQRWFTAEGGFVYDLGAAAPRGTSDLVDFLMISKRGYCEQFAASMAMMARILGIPARVAMGYTRGSLGPDGRWVVRSRDAHAWPELYFEGAGWVRFEPTPAGGAGQSTATVPAHAQPEPEDDGQTANGGQSSAAPSPTGGAAQPSAQPEARDRTDTGDTAQAGEIDAAEDDGPPVGWLSAGMLVLLLLATPMAARLVARRRRWAQALTPVAAGGPPPARGTGGRLAPPVAAGDAAGLAHAAWQELRDDAIDHGVDWRPGDSPRAAARRITESLGLAGPAVDALRRLATAEERARYAPVPAPPDTLREDLRIVHEAFGAAVDRRTRWRARLAPPSTLRSLRESGRRAVGTVDGLSVTRLRDLARRRLRRG
ncbi:transglutaminaseTgpA domain-containing protein [Thermomonospora cellulosilytica]|uniref:Transglutaminase-like putative cysteine protease n=1 Tax=Thermomonospora cellulosilytica TaxID=1411118 RepID=A0A7W3RB25_9ACTN|nr:transglutaminaseTgpA domain-containing protein [Thermomonospora cellulosilytica]MBA9006512.1 transglutaminase-like putative cysteine protease [Thermomonospora cellulosilytica]